MSLTDGIVQGSADFGSTTYITLQNTSRSAYAAGMYKVYQDSVALSESALRQRAALEKTIDAIETLDQGLAAIGTEFQAFTVKLDGTPLTASDPPGTATKQVQRWVAANKQEASDLAWGLLLSGEAPPTVSLILNDDGNLEVTPDLTNMVGRFYYNANEGISAEPDWREAVGTSGVDLIPTYDPLTVEPFWEYKLGGKTYNEVRPFNPDVDPKPFADDSEVSSFLPGTLVQKSGTNDYYIGSASRTLVSIPNPHVSGFLACRTQVDMATALDWKDTLKAGHEQLATVSQTQSEYISSLSSTLQNYLSLLSNLFQRLERTLNSLVDRS